jgi:hypothetical protein
MNSDYEECEHKNSGSSPTGWWCNDCGTMDPCPCWIDNHQECIEERDKLRKDGKKTKFCCCNKKHMRIIK